VVLLPARLTSGFLPDLGGVGNGGVFGACAIEPLTDITHIALSLS
jgi:hypothetical protein